jgi:spore coat protein A, manganese oxidase
MVSRRRFLQATALTAVGLALPGKLNLSGSRSGKPLFEMAVAEAFSQSPGLAKFAQPLRGVGPGAIPVAARDGTRSWGSTIADHYTIDINEFQDTLHPHLGGPTTLRGFNPRNALGVSGVPVQKHLGGIIVAQKGAPVQITFRNNLPADHTVVPVDPTIMGADGATNRVSVHLHGGLVPWISDGGPFTWWAPDGSHGESFVNNSVLNPSAAPNEAEFYYPNNSSARLEWYHDHAVGITRLNAYSGIASAYIIRDLFEAGLVANNGLPDFIEKGGFELPIIIQDKIFVGADIATKDPTWTSMHVPQTPGSLWYPHIYEGARWSIGDSGTVDPSGNLTQNPSNIPEMFGDTMLANGTVFPVAQVQARRYRLRILNACQARFLNLQLYLADTNPLGDGGITYQATTAAARNAPTNLKGPDFLMIGTEGGFLSKPVLVNSAVPFDMTTDREGNLVGSSIQSSLLTGPAERWDVIVDFKGLENLRVILYNDAPAPFPMGEEINDYYLGSPDNPTQPTPGFGPNTRQIMAFDVGEVEGNQDPTLTIAPDTDLSAGIDPLLEHLSWTTQVQAPPPGVKVRQLTLNETFDKLGRLIQLLGTTEMVSPGEFGRHYDDPATEVVPAGSVEVWQIINLTGDTHPMHFHLINAQVLSRQGFPEPELPTTRSGRPWPERLPNLANSPARGPNELELGWKETIKMHPNEVTTIIMKFALPTQVPFNVPVSPRTGGHEYVWHCHILDHEEHDMMRPMIVTNPFHTYLPFVSAQRPGPFSASEPTK